MRIKENVRDHVDAYEKTVFPHTMRDWKREN